MLAVLLHGGSFRIGGQHSLTATSATEEQKRALSSVRTHVLTPASYRGWHIEMYIDTMVNMNGTDLNTTILREVLCSVAIKSTPVRIASELEEDTQTLSLAAETHRIVKHLARIDALLFLRIDMEFKMDLQLPRPARNGPIRVPWITRPGVEDGCRSGCLEDGEGTPIAKYGRIADTLFFVPFESIEEWQTMLTDRADCIDLHLLKYFFYNVATLEPLQDSYLQGGYDADSQKAWNPLYRLIGRPEAERVPDATPPVPSNDTASCWEGCFTVLGRIHSEQRECSPNQRLWERSLEPPSALEMRKRNDDWRCGGAGCVWATHSLEA